jgi:hypothetical protein
VPHANTVDLDESVDVDDEGAAFEADLRAFPLVGGLDRLDSAHVDSKMVVVAMAAAALIVLNFTMIIKELLPNRVDSICLRAVSGDDRSIVGL